MIRRILFFVFVLKICLFLTPDEYLNIDIDDYKHPNSTEKLTEE